MTRQEFEKVYEQHRNAAIRAAMSVCRVSRARAEDAVQNAAIYCLECLERFERITASYFIQLVVSRARHITESENARGANREHGVGGVFDLADVEEADNERRLGRISPAVRAE